MYRFLSPALIVLVPQDLNCVDCVACGRLLYKKADSSAQGNPSILTGLITSLTDM